MCHRNRERTCSQPFRRLEIQREGEQVPINSLRVIRSQLFSNNRPSPQSAGSFDQQQVGSVQTYIAIQKRREEIVCRCMPRLGEKPFQHNASVHHVVQNRRSLSSRISSELSERTPTRSRICSRRRRIRSTKAWLRSESLTFGFFPWAIRLAARLIDTGLLASASIVSAVSTSDLLGPPLYRFLSPRLYLLNFLNQRRDDVE